MTTRIGPNTGLTSDPRTRPLPALQSLGPAPQLTSIQVEVRAQLKTRLAIPLLALLLGVLGAAAAPLAAAAEVPACGANFFTLELNETGEWGYRQPAPWASLSDSKQKELMAKYPLESVGAILTTNKPWRATTFYLGEFNGEHLFATAEHVTLDNEVLAVQFGHLADEPFQIPIKKRSDSAAKSGMTSTLAASVDGDFSIMTADDSQLSPKDRERLKAMRPSDVVTSTAEEIYKKFGHLKVLIPGRGILPGALADAEKYARTVWTERYAQKYALTQAEAAKNKDTRPIPADKTEAIRQGDIFVVLEVDILGGGISAKIFDPDGLEIGNIESNAFMEPRPGWKPLSYAALYRSLGRMSGSPAFIEGADGQVAVIGLHWTKAIPNGKASQPVPNSPEKAKEILFPKFKPQTIDGKKKQILIQDAGYGFISATSAMHRDFKKSLAKQLTQLMKMDNNDPAYAGQLKDAKTLWAWLQHTNQVTKKFMGQATSEAPRFPIE